MKRLAALGAFQLSLFLKQRESDTLFTRYSRLISADVSEDEMAAYPETPEALFFDQPAMAARYQKLYGLCEGDPIALCAIQLYLMALMEEQTTELLREGLGLAEGLTIEAAGKVACRWGESIELVPRLRRAFERVEVLLQAEPGKDYLKAPFSLDGRLAAYLAGDDTPDRHLTQRHCAIAEAQPLSAPVLLSDSQTEAALRILAHPGFSVMHISGEGSCGRRYFARYAAHRLEKELLMVPFGAVSTDGRLDMRAWRRVLRELLLSERLLCLYDLHSTAEDRATKLPVLLRQMAKDLAPLDRPVFWITEPAVKVAPFLDCPVYSVQLPRPTIPQSAQLWQELAARYLPEAAADFPALALASKMTLSAGQIERIVHLLQFQNPCGPWTEREIFRLCYQVLDDGRYENIRFVDAVYTWEDLQLEPSLKATIRAICAQVEHQSQVLDQWGLRRRYPYGRCVSVLMSGPPGTGKTMTAQVLASQLGLELYKVDLSQIVDKYIGETEKRLREVFDQAEKSNMVLFFDEADALLGKRSEVKDAKDKFANTEVAYLLQRIEEYQGIVLMATNQAGNMDQAFSRRFRYHMVFTLPDETLRRRIWEDALRGIPAEGIQTDYLARQFSLSGAQIKNIILNGAYRAAADSGTLHMEHLVQAVFQELQKEGRLILTSEFGEYGVMLSNSMSEGVLRQGT